MGPTNGTLSNGDSQTLPTVIKRCEARVTSLGNIAVSLNCMFNIMTTHEGSSLLNGLATHAPTPFHLSESSCAAWKDICINLAKFSKVIRSIYGRAVVVFLIVFVAKFICSSVGNSLR